MNLAAWCGRMPIVGCKPSKLAAPPAASSGSRRRRSDGISVYADAGTDSEWAVRTGRGGERPGLRERERLGTPDR
jgi:hypothetical protein